jgi:CRP-like cAMP-binding protein
MPNPLIAKLERGAKLTDEDRRILDKLVAKPHRIGPREDIISEGEEPDSVHLVMEGFACRYHILPDGKRQIMAYLVPGDICDFHVAILGEMDHSIGTLTACSLVDIPHETVHDITTNHPNLNRAFWWATLVDEGILREWLVSLGRRSADQRLAHLFCELLIRLQTVGLADHNSFEMPLTQEELADTLGLSNVHVNRMMQELREKRLISTNGRRLTIGNVARLQEFAEFNPNFLHLGPKGNTTNNGSRDVLLSVASAKQAQ